MKISKSKDIIRKDIKQQRASMDDNQIQSMSDDVFETLEILGIFQEAKCILVYKSLKGEVSTHAFIEKWIDDKDLFCPCVIDEELIFRSIKRETHYINSSYGVSEPVGEDFTEYSKIDLVIVPGVAFDIHKNRLGFGKGYYDKFLKNIKAPKLGICFDYQVLDKIPTTENDIKMDYVISENNLIW